MNLYTNEVCSIPFFIRIYIESCFYLVGNQLILDDTLIYEIYEWNDINPCWEPWHSFVAQQPIVRATCIPRDQLFYLLSAFHCSLIYRPNHHTVIFRFQSLWFDNICNKNRQSVIMIKSLEYVPNLLLIFLWYMLTVHVFCIDVATLCWTGHHCFIKIIWRWIWLPKLCQCSSSWVCGLQVYL